MINSIRQIVAGLFGNSDPDPAIHAVSNEKKHQIATYFAELYRAIYPNMSKASYEGIKALVYTETDATLGTKSETILFSDAGLKKLAAQIIRSDAQDDTTPKGNPIPAFRSAHKDADFNDEVASLKSGLSDSKTPLAYTEHEARLAAQLSLLQKVRYILCAMQPTQEDFIQAATEWLDAASKVSSARSR